MSMGCQSVSIYEESAGMNTRTRKAICSRSAGILPLPVSYSDTITCAGEEMKGWDWPERTAVKNSTWKLVWYKHKSVCDANAFIPIEVLHHTHWPLFRENLSSQLLKASHQVSAYSKKPSCLRELTVPKHVYLYAVKGKQALASCVLLHHIGFQDRAHHSAEVH